MAKNLQRRPVYIFFQHGHENPSIRKLFIGPILFSKMKSAYKFYYFDVDECVFFILFNFSFRILISLILIIGIFNLSGH